MSQTMRLRDIGCHMHADAGAFRFLTRAVCSSIHPPTIALNVEAWRWSDRVDESPLRLDVGGDPSGPRRSATGDPSWSSTSISAAGADRRRAGGSSPAPMSSEGCPRN